MKVTRNQLRNIIKKSLIKEENIVDKVVGFFKDLSAKKPDERDVKSDLMIQGFFGKLNNDDLKIAKSNYEKLKKEKRLYNTIFDEDGSLDSEEGYDAKVMSYLLLGHPDFKDMTQPEIESYLAKEIKKSLKHDVKSESTDASTSYIKKVGENIVNSENREIFSSISSQKNTVSGGESYSSSGKREHVIGKESIRVSWHAHKLKNIPDYKYGSIEVKGKGLESFFAIVRFEIGDYSVEFMNIKNAENIQKNEEYKEKSGAKNGLYINGEKSYGYEGPYSNGMSYPGAYESAVSELSKRIGNLKSKYPKSEIVSGIIKNYLGQLEFNVDDFNRKRSNTRELVLITKDGTSIVGEENVDAFLASKLPKVNYKKV